MSDVLTNIIEMLTIIRDGSFDEVEQLVKSNFYHEYEVKQCAGDNEHLFQQLIRAHALQQASNLIEFEAEHASKEIAASTPDDVDELRKTMRAVPHHITQVMLADRQRELVRRSKDD